MIPALRDGLWHHGVQIDDSDVEVCFYGDLFRRAPGTEAERRLEQSRAGIAEAMTEAGGDAIAALVDSSTRVLVAHSLGTLLSYMALSNHPQWPIRTFVTLGSPLASPMMFAQLEPTPVDGQGQWPGSIERCVNVRAVGDKAAAIALADKFGPRVEDVLVDNGHRAHAPEPYLNAAVTGAAVAAALSEAIT